MKEDVVRVLCTNCKKRLFDANRDMEGTLAIKCTHCGTVQAISFHNMKIKAEQSAVK